MTRTPSTIGRAIRARRMRCGLSLRAMARDADMAPSTLSRVERDLLDPSWPHLRRIALALRLRPSQLVADLERAKP